MLETLNTCFMNMNEGATRMKRAREQFRKIRERRQAKQQTEQTVVSQ